jgi:hypothetical protein
VYRCQGTEHLLQFEASPQSRHCILQPLLRTKLLTEQKKRKGQKQVSVRVSVLQWRGVLWLVWYCLAYAVQSAAALQQQRNAADPMICTDSWVCNQLCRMLMRWVNMLLLLLLLLLPPPAVASTEVHLLAFRFAVRRTAPLLER